MCVLSAVWQKSGDKRNSKIQCGCERVNIFSNSGIEREVRYCT